MNFGSQLEVPQGLGGLKSGVRYYYAGRSSARGALLVWFFKALTGEWRVGCLHMNHEILEEELTASPPGLKPCKLQFTLPAAIQDLAGINFNELFVANRKGQPKDKLGAQQRLEAIYPLLDIEDHILGADQPLRLIAQTAKKLGLKTHQHRLQYWFFAFILHSRNLWALKAATQHNGTWSRRDGRHANKKFGRPSLAGARHGWPSALFRDEVIKCYLRHCGLGISMRRIHTRALIEDFGCVVRAEAHGVREIFHPQNKPYPTYGQFRDVVVRNFGLEEVQKAKYGQARMHRAALVDNGSSTEQFANLLENVEVDAYRCADRPLSLHGDRVMPALVVARAICSTSGARVGIGFSLGGEKQEAYRAMLFSMAAPKEVVARLYGIPRQHLDWPMQGMCRSMLSDRGPAGQQSILEELEGKFPVKAITPSYSGQSKPNVESANPRSTQLEGEPTFIASDLNVADMMRREVLRAASENRSTNIVDRLPHHVLYDFHQLGYPATPQAYWKYLEDRLRTSAQPMDFSVAVRAFCMRRDFTVDKTGVRFNGMYFRSAEFTDSGAHQTVVQRGIHTLRGYTLSMVQRYIWAECDGRLFELEACRRTRFDHDDLFIPLSKLEDFARLKAQLASRTRQVADAARSELDVHFNELTGKTIFAGVRKRGSPPKNQGAAAAEAKVIRADKKRRVA